MSNKRRRICQHIEHLPIKQTTWFKDIIAESKILDTGVQGLNLGKKNGARGTQFLSSMSKNGKKDNFKNIHPKDPGIGRFMFMMIHRVKRAKSISHL